MRPPSSRGFEQQLLMQRIMQQSALQQEEAAFGAERQRQQDLLKSKLEAEAVANEKAKQEKIAKSVNLGTLLTSARGLLGNPVLSITKLGG